MDKMSSLDLALREMQLELEPVTGRVSWCSSNPKHPRNWSLPRKIWDIGLIVLLEVYTCVRSNITMKSVQHLLTISIDLQLVLPECSTAARYSQERLNISLTLSQFLFVSTYLLAQGLGGVVFPPYAEAFGRKKLYVISTVLYSGFCAIIGGVDSPIAAVIGRLVTGFLSAIPTCSITGSIEDMFNSKDRIWMMLCYIGAANLGVAMGPVMSAYITFAFSWQWIFYIAAMITGGISLLLLSIRESRPSLVLEGEVKELRKRTGIETLECLNHDSVPDMKTFVQVNLGRPVKLLCTEPIVFCVSFMGGTAMAIIYLLTEALPKIYEAKGFDHEQSSLPFLALGIGFIFNVPGRLADVRTANALRKNDCHVPPEYKLAGLKFAAPILAGALWWFAWTIPPTIQGVHWIVSVFALLAIGYGRNELSIVLTGYLADSYSAYTGSAFAAWGLLRAILSAVFPLFAPVMFDALGANVAVSVLAGAMTVFMIIPLSFRRYGKALRERSKFAQYSMQRYKETTVEKDGT
ncbi:unnamed protein product [Penicillium salamii]|uniref:Major facilitator superfamily (MFS) profile domain-containing protein n=1 Tax=Penicillium salamii TaxID=1612424 RepID=A0A9W4IUW7_9EURO|nr:unnamed protein product [Penicillium salamii]CAG8349388.1 unnamed protein product [Penicillium salamii]CAG8416472.1 unnamed protein product [Penicillium salamii]